MVGARKAHGLYGYTKQPYRILATRDTTTNKRNARQREPALALDLDLPASNQFEIDPTPLYPINPGKVNDIAGTKVISISATKIAI